MKTVKTAVIAAISLLFLPTLINSQQMFHVHEDQVKPSMTMEYETVLKEVWTLMKEHPIQGLNTIVFQGSNNHYYYLEPIEAMADLDKPSLVAQLAEKVGKQKVTLLFKRLDKCYDIEKNYILTLNSDLSYMPNGMTQTPKGENYREQYKIYVTPGNRAAVKEKMVAIKNLYNTKGSQMFYRIYESGFGTDAEFYLVSVAAKDAADMAAKDKANKTLMGDEGQKAMFGLFENILKIEEIEGEMRPDLAITSN